MNQEFENQEIQLHFFEILSEFKNHSNIRKRLKTTPFKILNGIYLFTRHNEKKGREHTFPGKELLMKIAKTSRRQVTEFINSEEIGIFCEVKHRAFESNEYVLRDWVYQWFRLFYRSGMMKGIHVNYERWMGDFKKRINKWLLPLVQAGRSIKDIYEGLVNRLSTRNQLKGSATNPLKGSAITSFGELMKPTGSEDIEKPSPMVLPAILELHKYSQEMVNRFHVREADSNSIINSFTLRDIKKGIIIRSSWEKNGITPKSPVRTMIGAIKKAIGMRI